MNLGGNELLMGGSLHVMLTLDQLTAIKTETEYLEMPAF
jgi:hypothetical protein